MSEASPELTKEQWRVVEAPPGQRSVVVAGAGSGKTEVIAQRYLRLLEDGLSPRQILVMTYTDLAAASMRERIFRRARQAGYQPLGEMAFAWIMTFHAFCQRVLTERSLWVGLGPRVAILADAEQRLQRDAVWAELAQQAEVGIEVNGELIYRPLEHQAFPWSLDRHGVRGPTEKVCEELRNRLVSPEEFWQTEWGPGLEDAAKRQLVPLVCWSWERYQRRLAERGWLDFHRLNELAVALLEKYPAVAETYACQFHAILVDEFQDAADAQFRILKALLRPATSLTVVGDPRQTLYGWRGAAPENLRRLEQEGARQFSLTVNHRSLPPILDVANSALEAVKNKATEPLFDRQHTLRPSESRLQEARELDPSEPVVILARFTKTSEQVRYVLEEVQRLQSAGVPLRQIAILFRKRKSGRAFEKALRQARIPYKLSKGATFFQRPEVAQALAWFRALVDADDDLALLRLLRYEAGLRDGDLDALRRRWGSLGDALRFCTQGETEPECRAQALREKLVGLRRKAAYASPGQACRLVLGEAGVYAWALARDDGSRGQAVLNLRKLQRLADRYERSFPGKGLHDLAAYLRALFAQPPDEADEPSEVAEEAVALYTVHGAKGLEFDHVFLVEAQEFRPGKPVDVFYATVGGGGKLVVKGSSELTNEEEELVFREEERLHNEGVFVWYVGLTRAAKRLHVLRTDSKSQAWEELYQKTDGLGFFEKLWNDAARREAEWPQVRRFQASVAEASPDDTTAASSPPLARDLALDAASALAEAKRLAERLEEIARARVRPVRLSYTALQTFLDCPLRYRLQYRAGLREGEMLSEVAMGEEEEAGGDDVAGETSEPWGRWPIAADLLGPDTYRLVGLAVHETLAWHALRPQATKRDLVARFVASLDLEEAPDKTEVKAQMEALGRSIFAAYYASPLRGIPPRHDLAERRFEVRLAAPDGSVLVDLVGAIDRITQAEERWELVDYKVHGALDRSRVALQLTLYEIAWAEVVGRRGDGAVRAFACDLLGEPPYVIPSQYPGGAEAALGVLFTAAKAIADPDHVFAGCGESTCPACRLMGVMKAGTPASA